MRERPILFSDAMVRAILSGSKTQTRRVVSTREGLDFIGGSGQRNDPECWGWFFDSPEHHGYMVLARGLNERFANGCISIPCPYGEAGDRLWVRECFALHRIHDGNSPSRVKPSLLLDVDYRADAVRDDSGERDGWWFGERFRAASHVRWRPSIHMPRWASRLTLEVKSVRVERLTAITKEDAIAEGARSVEGRVGAYGDGPRWSMESPHPLELDRENGWKRCLGSPQMAFAAYWNQLAGDADAFDANPWVWVVTFERVEVERD